MVDFLVNGSASNPEALQAAITRKKRALYEARYRPIEQRFLSSLLNPPIQSEAQVADATAAQQGQITRGMFMRMLERQGVSMRPDQATAMERRMALQTALNRATAYNTTSRHATERNTALLNEALNIGKGVSGAAGSDASSAASMASARRQAYEQAKAQHKVNTINTAASLAGLGAALWVLGV